MLFRAAAPRRLLPWLLLLALALPAAAAGQILPVPGASGRTARRDTVPSGDSLAVSPRGAFLRSLAVPGWGQAYVGVPGRGGVYFAMEAGSLWMTVKSHRQLQASRERDRGLRAAGILRGDTSSTLTESRRNQREDWITFSIFMLFFSGADAYVAAHLSDFAEHIGVRPTPGGGMRIEAALPVGRRRR